MARLGSNPNRNSKAPARLTDTVLTCVTHLPEMRGYHMHRFEVVKKCLTSMREHAGGGYSVAIWDNGSCEAFREWVTYEYQPDVFVQSVNIGKSAARAALFGMVDSDAIVTYCDDDIYFYPDWLKPQIEILRRFPDASCVTGYPVRTAFRWGVEQTHRRLHPRSGRFIPQDWEDDFAVSIGRDIETHRATTENDVDYIVERDGLQAYATAHHCQFIGRAGVLLQAARKVMMYGAMPDEKPFDIELDRLGNRLATTQRLARHIGNYIDDDLRRDIDEAEKKV